MHGPKGFSLVELLIIMTIITIIALIAAPAITTYNANVQLKSAVMDLKSNMELAKMRAIRANAHVALIFDTGAETYTIFVDDGEGAGAADNWICDGSETLIRQVTIPETVDMYAASFAGGVPRFRFDGRGLPNGFGGHCYMKNTENRYRGVSLSMVGMVRIQTSPDGGVWQDEQ